MRNHASGSPHFPYVQQLIECAHSLVDGVLTSGLRHAPCAHNDIETLASHALNPYLRRSHVARDLSMTPSSVPWEITLIYIRMLPAWRLKKIMLIFCRSASLPSRAISSRSAE